MASVTRKRQLMIGGEKVEGYAVQLNYHVDKQAADELQIPYQLVLDITDKHNQVMVTIVGPFNTLYEAQHKQKLINNKAVELRNAVQNSRRSKRKT